MSVTTEPTDPELLDRMASGDREALAIVFRRHQGTVYRFSRQMLGSSEAAEDVTQDVFVALAKSAGRFNPAVASLSTYLYGIARHLVLQRYKRSRTRIEVNIEAMAGADEGAFATSSDPAETMSRAQATRELRRAILRLPVHYREVVVLCELNGLSYEEAATIAGCPVGTVRSRLSRARQMLIERCKPLLAPDRAEVKGQGAGGRGQRAEGRNARNEEMADSNEAQLLSDLLRDLGREDERFDAAHLEARVMSAAARSTPPSFGAARWTRAAVVAAAAVAVLGSAAFWATMQTPVEKEQLKVEATEEVIARASNTVSRTGDKGPAKAGPYVAPGAATLVTAPSAPITPSPIAASPIAESPIAESALVQSPVTQSPIARSHDEFVPLLPMTEQELAGPFQIVRVQMPRGLLGNLRSPLEYPNELVEADVLLGEDGTARAIRVSTDGSVYPRRPR